jgi:hypothetical protein
MAFSYEQIEKLAEGYRPSTLGDYDYEATIISLAKTCLRLYSYFCNPEIAPHLNLLNNDESLGIHPTARCIRCGGAMEILDMRCANECE